MRPIGLFRIQPDDGQHSQHGGWPGEDCFLWREGWRADRRDQSLVYRGDRDAGYVYGVAGYGDCECGFAAYCGWVGGQRGGEYLGADQLSGVERGGAAAFGLVEPGLWAEAVLHVVRGVVHDQFPALRVGAQLGVADFVSGYAGDWRRRAGSCGAGDFGGYISGKETSRGVCFI